MISISQRAFILLALGLLLLSTRSHYFALLPDASWAVFFIAGFYLHRWRYKVFLILISLAVLVDWQVINAQGINFWQHYCISIGYGFLLPAYYVMWAGGKWLRQHYYGINKKTLVLFLLSLSASTALCHLLAQGGFYWFSESVSNLTFVGWAQNYGRWLLPYWSATLLYSGIVAVFQLRVQTFRKPIVDNELLKTENN